MQTLEGGTGEETRDNRRTPMNLGVGHQLVEEDEGYARQSIGQQLHQQLEAVAHKFIVWEETSDAGEEELQPRRDDDDDGQEEEHADVAHRTAKDIP